MTAIDDLGALVTVEPGTRVSHAALAADGVRVVVFAFDAGTEMTEHTAPGPILLQVQSGHLRITTRDETVDLRPGGLVHIAARVPHAVVAVEPSVMQLTLIRRTTG